MAVDTKTLKDLVKFCKLEQEANDIEPWAAVIAALQLDDDPALWLLKLYNTFDDMSSAGKVIAKWHTPTDWYNAPDKGIITDSPNFPISRERRNLYGGRVVRHLDAYVEAMGKSSQSEWMSSVLGEDPEENFVAINTHLRTVWGAGRQTAFEWAEFYAKILHAPIEPPNALLWESSGPKQSLESLYGLEKPTEDELEETAIKCKAFLEKEGIPLSWWDFETVICDFHVMRKGRYYPGKHIAMLRDEIESLSDPGRSTLRSALEEVIPEKWITVPNDKSLWALFKEQGKIYHP